MNVQNKKCIRNLSIKNMKATRLRNIIAVIAIVLTTVLFTSLFTIVMSVVNGFEQSNFRQVGGYEHGGLKNLTTEQFEEFKNDSHIAEYGKRVFIGIPEKAPFNKSHVEVSSIDKNYAKFTFVDFEGGGLPTENTNEAAADSRVLSLLGVPKKIGTEFSLTFNVAGKETTENFILSGFWEFDEVMPANNVLLPFSRAEEIFEKLKIEKGEDGYTGMVSLDFMLKSGSKHIEKDICEMIENHGYQHKDKYEPNYIGYGVNWGYVASQVTKLFGAGTVLALVSILILIIFTGYLIIYNVFRISVSNDIRYYGLLKTIGTTSKQIKRIIHIQAGALSAAGIPLGLVIGYLIGVVLVPLVSQQLNGIQNSVSYNPIIFIGSALFSVFTVLLSCLKPGKIASKVSPIEALRYTESSQKKSIRKSTKGANIPKMAAANLSRTKNRTIITILSLAMSVVLLNLTATFTKGFDEDKYIEKMIATDFHIADAKYYQSGVHFSEGENAITENVISDLNSVGGISDGGRTYGISRMIWDFLTEQQYRNQYSKWYSQEMIDAQIELQKADNGFVINTVQLYGMEKFCLDNMVVVEGDISKLYGNGNYIAAVYRDDDYGNVLPGTHWAKLGDKIPIWYVEEFEVDESHVKATKYREAEYEVAALVVVTGSLSYRYYSSDQFILNAEIFKRDTGTSEIMYYAFDADKGAEDAIENFLLDYTENKNPLLNYESKKTYMDEFKSFKQMFLVLGLVLSFVVGLVGILNFINAVFTGMFARRREFAVLQAVGMTGKQLKSMLIVEGIYYTLGSTIFSLLLCVIFSPLEKKTIENMFWFFSFNFTVFPILILIPVFAILGVIIPLVSYRIVAKKSVVERLSLLYA